MAILTPDMYSAGPRGSGTVEFLRIAPRDQKLLSVEVSKMAQPIAL